MPLEPPPILNYADLRWKQTGLITATETDSEYDEIPLMRQYAAVTVRKLECASYLSIIVAARCVLSPIHARLVFVTRKFCCYKITLEILKLFSSINT